ncbi:MAG: zinc-dependent metalloprotease [Salibacteraceae bacterium]|nr:zinc-dependent metalloprotease [Salibacteraceae bacterium]
MRYLWAGILSIVFFTTNAQQKCGQQILENQLRSANPALEEAFQNYENWISQTQYQSARADKIIIPVVFHVIHQNGVENIIDEQILDAVRIMNEDYAAINDELTEIDAAFVSRIGTADIEFRLARKDPSGNATNGIDRIESAETSVGDDGSKLNPWPRSMYLNIWVTDVISVGGAAAYAYRPISVAGSNSASVDGIISNHRYVGSIGTASNTSGKTLTHEIGHYLGLPHTWGPTNEPGLATNCSVDDGISDTPNTIGVGNSSCNTAQVSCSSQDNVQNFMDYASCESMFTTGQVNVMRGSLNSSVAERNKLGTSSNLAATGLLDLTEANYYTPTQTICRGEILQLFDASAYEPDSWSWTLTSPYNTYTSADQNPEILMDFAGVFDLELTVTQGSVTKTMIQKDAIAVLEYVGSPVPYFEDFATVDYGWITDEHDVESSRKWEYDTQNGNGDNFSYKFYNIGSETQSIHDLMFASLDMRSLTSVSIAFDVAYRQFQATNTDKLALLMSNDCGKVWRTVWSRSGEQLSNNAPLSSSVFAPSAGDFTTFTVNNVPIQWASESTLFAFRFTSGGGNNLYLDNINISGDYGQAPYLVYPGNGAQGVPASVVLDWLHVHNASAYQLEMDTDAGFGTSNKITRATSAIGNESTAEDTETLLENLTPGQEYFWRVRATVGGSQTAWSETWSFTITDNGVGIGEMNETALHIFPNPVSERLYISGEWSAEAEIYITSISGQIVMKNPMVDESSMSVDVSNLTSGVFVISIVGSNSIVTKQFVKAQ